MANWENAQPIDYSPNGDDVDRFAQKSKATFEQIFTLLNILRANGAVAGTDTSGDVPYSWHVDTSTDTIYMTDANNELVEMGQILPYFGIQPENIGAVKNKGGMGSFTGGTEANIPQTGNSTYDWYWAYDTSRIFMWTGSAWRIIFSLNFSDILNYERYCVSRNEVGYSGNDKILRLDSETGKGNIDITGSPERLLGLLIDTQDLQDDHVLVYDADKQKIVNKPRNDINSSDITYTGEARKVVAVSQDGTIHGNLTGAASHIGTPTANVKVNPEGITDNDLLRYDSDEREMVPVSYQEILSGAVTYTGEAGKIAGIDADDGKLHAEVEGTATGLNGIQADTAGIAAKTVLGYDATSRKLKPIPYANVYRDALTTTGEAGKIVQVDPNDGKIHGNVTGYASGLSGIPVNIAGINEDYVLAYDSTTHTFVARTRGALNDDDIAHSEADVGKVVTLNDNGMIPFSITGNAAKILGKAIVSDGLQDGQILVYRTATNQFVTEAKGTIGAGKSLILRNSGDLIATYDGSETTNVDLHEVIDDVTSQSIAKAVAVAYKDGGSKVFANLPALTEANRGVVCNLLDDFVTTDDFVEGAGRHFSAGANVAVVEATAAAYVPTEDTTAAEGKMYYTDAQGTEATPQPNKGADISEAGYYELIPAHYVPTEDTTAQAGKTYYVDNEGTYEEAVPQPSEGDDISEAGYYEYVLAEYVLTADHYAKAGKTYYRTAAGGVLNPQPPKGDDISEAGYYEYRAATYKYDVQGGTAEASDTVAGVAKIYNTTGNHVDGSITQAAATTALTALQGHMTTAQGNITTLQGDMATAQGDIASLQNAITMTYKAKGSVAFANLPATLDATKRGWVYNVYDDFTTDSRFVEGAGSEYFAGENVVVAEVSPDAYVPTEDTVAVEGKTYYANAQGEELITQPTAGDDISEAGYYEFRAAVYMFDVLSGYVDLSGYVQTSTLTGNYAKVTGWDSSTGTLTLSKP